MLQKCGDYSASPPNLLLLCFSSFHTNPTDFQHRFGRLCVPGPESLFNVLPDGVPGFRFSFPAQADLQQVTNILLSKHQEGVGQVQTDSVIMAGKNKRENQVKSGVQTTED